MFGKSANLWMVTAALLLPFGWIVFLLRPEPVWVRVRSLLRR